MLRCVNESGFLGKWADMKMRLIKKAKSPDSISLSMTTNSQAEL